MKRTKLETVSTEELITLFERAAQERGAAILDLDVSRANAAYRRCAAVFEQLVSRGAEAPLQLVRLLDNPDPAVRLLTAQYLFKLVPERARPVLEELTKHPEISFSADAGMSLYIHDKKI